MAIISFLFGCTLVGCFALYSLWQAAEWRIEQLESALWQASEPADEEFDFDVSDLFDD